MSNSTQNDEIGKMEKAIDEGFAESERDLKDKKTPLDKPSTQNDWAEDCPEFGDYVYIPQKRYGCENEIYQYLVIECLKSNAYVDVPVQTPAVETPHKDIVPVVSCLCGGVGHKEVLKYRLSDIVRVEKNPRISDARREVINDRIDRLKLYEVIENIYLSGMYTHDKGILRQYMSDIINVLATLKEETL